MKNLIKTGNEIIIYTKKGPNKNFYDIIDEWAIN